MREGQSIHNARRLRKQMTEAEKILWYHLRDRRFFGVKFRRQATIGVYVVDFVAMEEKLVIELDGGQHRTQQLYDQKRDTYLKSQGFTVMRFWNNDLFENKEGVLTQMRAMLPSPHPNPLPRAGEGTTESASC